MLVQPPPHAQHMSTEVKSESSYPPHQPGKLWYSAHASAAESNAPFSVSVHEYPSLDENGNFISVYNLDGLQRSWINKASFGLFDPPKPPQFDNRPKI